MHGEMWLEKRIKKKCKVLCKMQKIKVTIQHSHLVINVDVGDNFRTFLGLKQWTLLIEGYAPTGLTVRMRLG